MGWFVLSRSLLLGGGVLFWFRKFFSTEGVVPSKLRWVHMCPSSYRKGLSATATFVAVLLLLCWQTTCEQRVLNINLDECEQQLLVQYWV